MEFDLYAAEENKKKFSMEIEKKKGLKKWMQNEECK